MTWTRLRLLPTLLLGLALALPRGSASAARTADEEDARIAHALSRLTFGPRPGDLERVREIGLERWIEEQLHPERISEVRLDARLASLKTHGLSTAQLLDGYEIPREAKKEFQQKRASLGDDEAAMREARMELMARYAGEM
jgi:hypothetical protein